MNKTLVLCAFLLVACGNDADLGPDAGADGSQPDGSLSTEGTYSFDSRFQPGSSPVSRSGQVFRHVLIGEMKTYLAGLTAAVDTSPPQAGEVSASLHFYLDFDSTTSGEVGLALSTSPELAQAKYNDISTDKDLSGKLAGADSATDHKVWNTPGNFVGWEREGGETPANLIASWVQELDDLAVARVASPEQDPSGNPVSQVFLTSEGHDLQQLLQKFLLGAVAFSQGADDYLDDNPNTPGKGLLSSNLQEEGKPYSSLGHAWDEGFGYFGASIDYGDYTDEERAASGGRADYQGYHDFNGDNAIDLQSEFLFGSSTNCGKRDRDSDDSAKTSFGTDAFEGFRLGREFILSVDGELDSEELDQLRDYRDQALENWEKCIAATIVHYINEVEADMGKFGSEEYDFATHAKHWSELKGFALGLQFSPHSPLQEGTRFADLHEHIGMAPVLENAEKGAITAYLTALAQARTLMRDAYDFAQINVDNW